MVTSSSDGGRLIVRRRTATQKATKQINVKAQSTLAVSARANIGLGFANPTKGKRRVDG